MSLQATLDNVAAERRDRTAGFAAAYRDAIAAKRRTTMIGAAVLAGCVLLAAWGSEVDLIKLFSEFWRFPKYIADIMPTLRLSSFGADVAEWFWGIRGWLALMWETLLIAYVGTILGAMGGFALSFVAAANLTRSAPEEFGGQWDKRLKGAGLAAVIFVALLLLGRLAPSLTATFGAAAGLPGQMLGFAIDLVRLVATVVAFFAILWFLLGSRTLAKRGLEFCRTVPELVFALIFVIAFGLGPVPGVLAIAIHTMGALGKMFSEVAENIDMKPVDGVVATGGTWWQMVRFAVVPQVLSNYASYTLLRFEINVRGAAIMGFVGAGGIGQELITAIRKFYFTDVSALIVLIIATVMIIDLLTERLRHRFIDMERH
jgi:phosphonate ABC transporter permease subunit PhnE